MLINKRLILKQKVKQISKIKLLLIRISIIFMC